MRKTNCSRLKFLQLIPQMQQQRFINPLPPLPPPHTYTSVTHRLQNTNWYQSHSLPEQSAAVQAVPTQQLAQVAGVADHAVAGVAAPLDEHVGRAPRRAREPHPAGAEPHRAPRTARRRLYAQSQQVDGRWPRRHVGAHQWAPVSPQVGALSGRMRRPVGLLAHG